MRSLIPAVARGRTMDDVVLARFDYAKLDVARRARAHPARQHLRRTSAMSRNGVELAYVRAGKLHRVAAKHAVLACFNMVIPYIMPELPAAQREALAQNVKAPLVYTKVLVRNWQPWVKLGVHEISAPMSFHCRVKLDYPVSLGGYRHPRDPSEPMCLHLVHVPGAPNQGLDARTQFRIGRSQAAHHGVRASSRRASATSSTACSGRAASRPRATSRPSRSIAGRTAIPTRRIRCSTDKDDDAVMVRRASRSGA